MKNYIQLPLTLIAIFVLSACGTKPAIKPTGVVPNSLQTIEAAAEDIIDLAPSGGWEKISKDVTDIASAWKSYQPQANKAGASQELQDAMMSAIGKLETASAAKDSAGTMQGSNDVSAAVVELFSLYNPKVPAEISRLDVLERQVILDVAAKNYSSAEANLKKSMSVWEQVKPSVLEHHGEEVAAQFDVSLDEQAFALRAKDDATLTNTAKACLEIVDALEGLY